MIFSSLALLLAALAPELPLVAAQYQTTYGPAGNTSALVGTFSSGSGAVSTGEGFANPMNRSFTYPKTAGYSFSFTGDGYYEEARYRFTGNGSEPTCILGVIGWSHGTYTFNDNGSLSLFPYEDGFQQIQDPCAAVSNFIENYNGSELYSAWQVYTDTAKGVTARLYSFDGAPLPPMQQRSATPNMLPTRKLANATATASDQSSAGSGPGAGNGLRRRSNDSSRQVVSSWRSSGVAALGLAALGIFFL